jgi:hypothetical protein
MHNASPDIDNPKSDKSASISGLHLASTAAATSPDHFTTLPDENVQFLVLDAYLVKQLFAIGLAKPKLELFFAAR